MPLRFLQRWGQYLEERFPILPTLVFSFSYAGLAVGFGFIGIDSREKILRLVAFAAIFFLFLFRTRIVDEFKDASHDLKHYPDRPVPRGLISKNELIVVGIITFIAEITIVFVLGLYTLMLYVPVIVYSFLMGREFFIPRFLNRHFTLYFLTHEVIFIFFAIFYLLATKPLPGWSQMNFGLSVIALAMYPAIVEIARKFEPRYDKKGHTVADSYSVVWGRKNALFLVMLLIFTIGLILSYMTANNLFGVVALLGIFSLLILTRNFKKSILPISALTLISFTIMLNL